MRSASLAPAVRPDTRLLVLGSLPGAASLRAGRYYAHPRNQFWRLMGAVIGVELDALEPEARLASLALAGVGLWDVVASAQRTGSLDTAIRAPEGNDLMALVRGLPRLRAVGFNGAAAWRLGAPLLAEAGVTLIRLPSSSPAHARMTFEAKRAAWLVLREQFQGSGRWRSSPAPL